MTPPRPVRLVVVLDLTFVGGAEVLLLQLVRHLDPAAVRVRVVCLREEGPLAADFRAAGAPVDVLHRSGWHDVRTLPRLVRLLRRDRTDVVLVVHHHRAALLLGRLAARLARVRADVVAAHDMDLVRAGSRVLPRSTVETLFLSSALVLLAPSQGRYLRDHEGVGRYPWRRARQVVIPNGIALPAPPTPAARSRARAALGLAESDVVVGVVARLSPQKAHEVLFEAVARLFPRHPRLRLVVIGDGPRSAELAALAAELGIDRRVVFTGLRRDVADLLPGLDVACLSSVHEGVPIVLLEAKAAGLPVVATDCGAVRDVVAHGEEGWLVPVGDVDALAGRLGELLADPGLRRRFGRRGRERAEREHGIERTAEGYRDLVVGLAAR